MGINFDSGGERRKPLDAYDGRSSYGGNLNFARYGGDKKGLYKFSYTQNETYVNVRNYNTTVTPAMQSLSISYSADYFGLPKAYLDAVKPTTTTTVEFNASISLVGGYRNFDSYAYLVQTPGPTPTQSLVLGDFPIVKQHSIEFTTQEIRATTHSPLFPLLDPFFTYADSMMPAYSPTFNVSISVTGLTGVYFDKFLMSANVYYPNFFQIEKFDG